MLLTRLRLTNFRNHHHTEIAPVPGVNLFVGGNAQGKSSVLEAVLLAATGRSFRAQHDSELISLGTEWARVRAAVRRHDRAEEIDLGYRREGGGGQVRAAREIRVNGLAVRRGGLFGHLLAVMATPDDTGTVAGSPRLRRRLLDVLLAQISPGYYYVVQRYARVLLQRNRLLRGRYTGGLDAWDEQIATVGAAVTARRRALAARLAAAARPVYDVLSRGRETLGVEYTPSLLGGDEAAMAAFALEQLARRRADERVRGMTLIGPHRDELLLCVDGRELRTFGSRGQHLAAMLAVHLAERRVLWEEAGEEPVLLLDDILLTLDELRQGYLMEYLRGAQVVMTATTLATLAVRPVGTAVYQVADGAVEMERAHLP